MEVLGAEAIDWRAELEHLTQDDPGLTVSELAAQAGISKWTMRDMLYKGVSEGRYLKGKARRPGVPGRLNVYRIAPQPQAASRRQPKPKPRRRTG